MQDLNVPRPLLLEEVPHRTPSFQLQLAPDDDRRGMGIQDLRVAVLEHVRDAHPPVERLVEVAAVVEAIGAVDEAAGGVQDIDPEAGAAPVPEGPDTIAGLLYAGQAVEVGDCGREATRVPARDIGHAAVDWEEHPLTCGPPELRVEAKEAFGHQRVVGGLLSRAQSELRSGVGDVGLDAAPPAAVNQVGLTPVRNAQLATASARGPPLEHVGHGEYGEVVPVLHNPVGPELVRGLRPSHHRVHGPVHRVPLAPREHGRVRLPRGDGREQRGGSGRGAPLRGRAARGGAVPDRGRPRRRPSGHRAAGLGRRPVERPSTREAVVHVALPHRPQQAVGPLRLDDGEAARENDGGPRLGDGVEAHLTEDVVPLLLAEVRLARELQGGRQRKHLDAVDELGPAAKPRGVVDLALEENAGHVVLDELRRVVGVAVLHEEKLPDGVGGERQHGRAELLQVGIARDPPPEVQAVEEVDLL
mmetsp:Transcript_47144/g.105997  ORF Transcript_47144/g.105997 Transcript_47144/m.105997 type:complete len:473 (-) Transcript_47144:417-1835(-)